MGELASRARKLEDAFFLENDRKMMEEYKVLQKKEVTKKELAEVSGIKNETLLEHLVKLDVHAETVASFTLIPLIAVAWADGEVDEKEREAILKAANEVGAGQNEACKNFLDKWLAKKPKPALFDAWKDYIRELVVDLDKSEVEILRNEIIGQAQTVAQASGGFLGLGTKISPAEQKVLDQLNNAFL